MRNHIVFVLFLIQICVQNIPLIQAEDINITLFDSGSGSVAVPQAYSGVVLPLAVDSGSLSIVPGFGSGTFVGTGSAVVAGSGSNVSVEAARTVDEPIADQSPVHIVVTEVLWMGSDRSTADEWVEIAAFSSGAAVLPRSLSEWTLVTVKAGVETVIARMPSIDATSGSVIVIANYGAAVSRLRDEPAVRSTVMSLPNTQLLLRLKDASGAVIDEVDDGVGVPMAGANPSASSGQVPSGAAKASMQRVNPWVPGTLATNWKTATESIGFDDGPLIFGTPGTLSVPVIVVSSASMSSSSSVPPPTESSSSSVPVGVPVLPVQSPPVIRLTEVLANPVGADTDEWIEIGSFDGMVVDLAECALRMGTARYSLVGTLGPSQYVRIGKGESGLSLPNPGGTIELLWRDRVIDAWTYSETVEGVSLGRGLDGAVIAQCIPSPGSSNDGTSLNPRIDVQSSSVGSGKASFNLQAVVDQGSMAGASCAWVYPDGYASESCNPPSHSIVGPTEGDVILTMHDYCGNTMVRSLRVIVPGVSTPKDGSAFACVPTAFTGVTLSEFLPNPIGDETEGEWIELANDTDVEKPLCGWSIDDGESGSVPYRLDRLRLPAGERLTFPRPVTGIALNNDADAVRLFRPLPQGGSGAYEIIRYAVAPEGRSFARRSDGVWVWTTTPTPGGENAFAPVRWPTSVDVDIVRVMPNPTGVDADGGEWVELRNRTAFPLPLTGWTLETASSKTTLEHVILGPRETKRLEGVVSLANTNGYVRLVDREGIPVSTMAWETAKEGRSIDRPIVVSHLSDLSLRSSDDCVSWKAHVAGSGQMLARIDGIHIEKISECISLLSALSENEKIEQQIYSHGSSLFRRGIDIAEMLLREGLAVVADDASIEVKALYGIFEGEALSEKRGVWADEHAVSVIYERRMVFEQRGRLAHEGLHIQVSPSTIIIEKNDVFSVMTNVPAKIEVALGTGAFAAYEHPFTLEQDTDIRIRATSLYENSSGSSVISNMIQPYIIRKNRYHILRISEVYPSPNSGEHEWVEVWNPTAEYVRLTGWSLDDIADGGSASAVIDGIIGVGPGGRVVLSGSTIALNNTGDDVRLIDPNGKVSDAVSFPAVQKGIAVAMMGMINRECLTTVPTPGKGNDCVVQGKKTMKKSSTTARAQVRKGRGVRYKNSVVATMSTSRMRDIFHTLSNDGSPSIFGTNYVIFWLMLGLIVILMFFVLFKGYR